MSRLDSITITPEYFHSRTLATMPMDDAEWLVAYAKKLEAEAREAVKNLCTVHIAVDRLNRVLADREVNDVKAG